MSPHRKRLLVFGRVPVPGKVKTRLIPELGAEGAAALYERLLFATLAMAASMPDAEVEFWYDASDLEPAHGQEVARRFGVDGYCQAGDDLGERMCHALGAETSAPRRPALLIGSDCPGFDRAYLSCAFEALAETDAVLGPALDGGYVLIGVNRLDALLFADIHWSTSIVLEETRCRLRQLGWQWSELTPLQDIDCVDDLRRFPDLYNDRARFREATDFRFPSL